MNTEVLILGGGTSAVSAAIALAEMDVSCVIVEETNWIGGQLTSQAVPSDEHIWIEQFGSTRRYRDFRNQLGIITKQIIALHQIHKQIHI